MAVITVVATIEIRNEIFIPGEYRCSRSKRVLIHLYLYIHVRVGQEICHSQRCLFAIPLGYSIRQAVFNPAAHGNSPKSTLRPRYLPSHQSLPVRKNWHLPNRWLAKTIDSANLQKSLEVRKRRRVRDQNEILWEELF